MLIGPGNSLQVRRINKARAPTSLSLSVSLDGCQCVYSFIEAQTNRNVIVANCSMAEISQYFTAKMHWHTCESCVYEHNQKHFRIRHSDFPKVDRICHDSYYLYRVTKHGCRSSYRAHVRHIPTFFSRFFSRTVINSNHASFFFTEL